MANTKEVEAKKDSNEAKLEQGWRWVKVPVKDIYGYPFKGMYLNEKYFESGSHLVAPEVADALEERLVRWEEYTIHLMQPDADVRSLKELGVGKS